MKKHKFSHLIETLRKANLKNRRKNAAFKTLDKNAVYWFGLMKDAGIEDKDASNLKEMTLEKLEEFYAANI